MKRFSFLAVLTVALLAAPAAVAQETTFRAELTGQNEVPGVATDAFGTCTATLNEDRTMLSIACDHTLEDATAAHIHTGFPGVSGPVLFGLGDASSPITATWALTEDDLVRLLAGGLYVNVHTPAHPSGEIRGQLRVALPQGAGISQAGWQLTGDDEVPGVTTDADGACFAVLDDGAGDDNTLRLRCTHDVENASGAHIHTGVAGENGPILVDLGDATSPIDFTWTPTDAQLEMLRSGGLYVNVHSTANPEGEIRGQVAACFAGDRAICLQDGRFHVEVDWATDEAAGDAHPVLATEDSANFWFFRPGNLEMLLKVLDGCPVNDHYWVFFAAVTNVSFEVTVTDTLTGEQQTYFNNLGNRADSVLDTTAFATCE
ncbi:MAG TPA: CHRD domain-containing protein [Thermoanaerobaculia bacterium]|nr:CHRD domain-containing protein [Thermoanaerobaculia bacterium]